MQLASDRGLEAAEGLRLKIVSGGVFEETPAQPLGRWTAVSRGPIARSGPRGRDREVQRFCPAPEVCQWARSRGRVPNGETRPVRWDHSFVFPAVGGTARIRRRYRHWLLAPIRPGERFAVRAEPAGGIAHGLRITPARPQQVRKPPAPPTGCRNRTEHPALALPLTFCASLPLRVPVAADSALVGRRSRFQLSV